MTTKQVLTSGIALGFSVCIAVLTLLWFGVAGVLNIGRTDLMYILWPSSLMLTTNWSSSVAGVATIAVSIGINCLLYMAAAYGLYCVARSFGGSARP